MRPVLGILVAVLVSLAVPVGFLLLAALPDSSPEAGDGYVRGAIGLMLVLPPFAVLLIIYHGLGVLAVRAVRVHPFIVLFVLSLIASAVCAALFLASGAPLTWDRSGAFLSVMAEVWVLLALGSAVQYFICFRTPPPGAAEPAATGRQHA